MRPAGGRGGFTVRAALSAILLVPLLMLSPARATTWAAMGDDALVQYADIIVRGKITGVDAKDGRYPDVELGILEIAEVVYGPPDLQKVRLVLDEHMHGRVYRPGDSGTWFLRARPPGTAAMQQMEARRPPILAVARDAVFSASHPATFWPSESDAQRDGGKGLASAPQEWQQRHERLLRRVEGRLRIDVATLEKALEAANRNLDRVRRSTTQPSNADQPPKHGE